MKKIKTIFIVSIILLLIFISCSSMLANDTGETLLTQHEISKIKGEKDGYSISASIDSDKASKDEKIRLEEEADEKVIANPDLIKSDKDILASEMSEKESMDEKERLKAEADIKYANKKYEGKDIAPTEASIKKDKEEKEILEAAAKANKAPVLFEDKPHNEKTLKAEKDEEVLLLINKEEKTPENSRTDIALLLEKLRKKIEDKKAYILANNKITEFEVDESLEALARVAKIIADKRQVALDKIASMKYVEVVFSEEALQQLRDEFEVRHTQEIQEAIARLSIE